jgi:hypothetical protein
MLSACTFRARSYIKKQLADQNSKQARANKCTSHDSSLIDHDTGSCNCADDNSSNNHNHSDDAFRHHERHIYIEVYG